MRHNGACVYNHKARWRDKHHLVPKSRGGNKSPNNLLLIERDRHVRWHLAFGRRTLDEIIALLQRVKRAKENQGRKTVPYKQLCNHCLKPVEGKGIDYIARVVFPRLGVVFHSTCWDNLPRKEKKAIIRRNAGRR